MKKTAIFIAFCWFALTTFFVLYVEYLIFRPSKPYVILPSNMPVGSIGDIMYVSRNDKDTVSFSYLSADTVWQIKH